VKKKCIIATVLPSVAALVLLLLCTACGVSSDPADVNAANPGDFAVDLRRITLNASELGTVPGLNPQLSLSKFPEFATRDEVVWTSSDTSVATIDSATGAITVRTTPVSDPVTTMIRVEAVYDTSIYALCSLTVYPLYPPRRRWNFPAHPTGGGNNTLVSGDYNAGNGGTILQATGGGSGYNNGNMGPGIYEIDPEDPYEYGLIPSGGPRAGLNWD